MAQVVATPAEPARAPACRSRGHERFQSTEDALFRDFRKLYLCLGFGCPYWTTCSVALAAGPSQRRLTW